MKLQDIAAWPWDRVTTIAYHAQYPNILSGLPSRWMDTENWLIDQGRTPTYTANILSAGRALTWGMWRQNLAVNTTSPRLLAAIIAAYATTNKRRDNVIESCRQFLRWAESVDPATPIPEAPDIRAFIPFFDSQRTVINTNLNRYNQGYKNHDQENTPVDDPGNRPLRLPGR